MVNPDASIPITPLVKISVAERAKVTRHTALLGQLNALQSVVGAGSPSYSANTTDALHLDQSLKKATVGCVLPSFETQQNNVLGVYSVVLENFEEY